MLGQVVMLIGRDVERLERRNADGKPRLCFIPFSLWGLSAVSKDTRARVSDPVLPMSEGSSEASREDCPRSEVAYITINTYTVTASQ